MNRRQWTLLAVLALLVGVLWVPSDLQAMPATPVDETKVPHYFGPNPNWALSPLPTTGVLGNYSTGGIRKFVDTLPGLTPAGANNLGNYIPVATAQPFSAPGAPEADYYEIGLVQFKQQMHSDLPPPLLRGYVQLGTSAVPGSFPLTNTLKDGTVVPVLDANGQQILAVDKPFYLGPVIVAQKDRPVRITFRNLLPTGSGGDFFLPVDSTLMGSGMGPMNMGYPADQGLVTDEVRNPMCSEYPKSNGCFKDNRATLHLHGGISPWISDGTPHQWITPPNENTPWPQGVSVKAVPDMTQFAPGAGAMTFYYTNQQSARLMFYHDHAWGITRLNVYAGEAAGYLITDPTEQKLVNGDGVNPGVIPGAAYTIPLIIQDRTFVPPDAQLYTQKDAAGNVISYGQDPTWDKARWGGYGNLWYHHVYMPAQNPNDPSGMSAYGRWMFGPWFWPPADPLHGPIPNPYYNMDPATGFTTALDKPCSLNDRTSWQYQVDPLCEPPTIPGTPNISVGMEQFNDTPLVNGTAYPTTTVAPKAYRLRILNAANDRFFNLHLYLADPRTASSALNANGEAIGGTEVAFNAAELAAAQLDPVVFPTPDTSVSLPGPSWIQIASEGGFLPYPAVIPPQPITWITDPTRFDVGNVDQHSLLLAPAERADVIVDFSAYAGQTLILYNDAPAAFPARVATYDYYTGAPDLSPVGAPGVLPGFGPNTRTVMQIKVANTAPAHPFDLVALQRAFTRQVDPVTEAVTRSVFEEGQHPIIVGQAGVDAADSDFPGSYNMAYGTNFVFGSWCNVTLPPNRPPINTCDGLARIFDQGGTLFGFNTLASPNTKLPVMMEPKALHDEMNAVDFDEFGRMTANIGIENVPATPGLQNVTLYPYVNPATEFIDGTNLPKGDQTVTPISTQDGTQIWKITHNGVDTHPIHFHLYDVQLLNRVTWDNIVIPPDLNELGWKDTVRISPLEDTVVALRPVVPQLPWELPNSIRVLSPMMPVGASAGFNNTDVFGNPTDPVVNRLVNFGSEYVYHCHILSHEEMDMMRPVSLVLPPLAPTYLDPPALPATVSGNGNGARLSVNFVDNSIAETSYQLQKSLDGATWTNVATSLSPLDVNNAAGGSRVLTDPAVYNANSTAARYRVMARNTVGYGGQFPSMTASSLSPELIVGTAPLAPTTLTGALRAGPQVRLTFTDNAVNEYGFIIQRSTDGVNFTQIGTAPARNNTGSTTFTDLGVAATAVEQTLFYRVAAYNAVGTSPFSNTASVIIPAVPAAPTGVTAVPGPNQGNNRSVVLTWSDQSDNETGFTIQRATDVNFTAGVVNTNVTANATTATIGGLARNTNYYFRIRANNGNFVSSAYVNATPFPILTAP